MSQQNQTSGIQGGGLRSEENTKTWRVAPGDPTCVFTGDIAQPIRCYSHERAKLVAAAPELLFALREADDLIRDLIEADSGLACDHGVGICACGPRAMVARIRAALAQVAEVRS